MYLEKLLTQPEHLKENFDKLNNEEKSALVEEIKAQKDSLEKSKIVAETEIKSLESRREELLKELKDKFNLDSIESAEKKMQELNDEVVSALEEFASTINT